MRRDKRKSVEGESESRRKKKNSTRRQDVTSRLESHTCPPPPCQTIPFDLDSDVFAQPKDYVIPGAPVEDGRDGDTNKSDSTPEITTREKFKHTDQVSYSSVV